MTTINQRMHMLIIFDVFCQGDVISLNRQLLNHQITIARLSPILGPFEVTSYLNKCLYAVNMGSNDYINNYLLPQYYPSSKLFTPDEFAQLLLQQYSQQLKVITIIMGKLKILIICLLICVFVLPCYQSYLAISFKLFAFDIFQ